METLEEDIISDEEAEGGTGALKKLREKLKACKAERQEYLDGWQRTQADFVNARRENEARVLEAKSRGMEELVRTLVPVFTSLDLAAEQEGSEGLKRVRDQALSALKEAGIDLIAPIRGEPFDPGTSLAVGTEPAENEDADHTIAKTVQRGFRRGETVIEPAKVVIAVSK